MNELQESLAAFKPPYEGKEPQPYVLYWRDTNMYKDNVVTVQKELTCMTCVNGNGTADKILYYTGKPGWQVVGYWFPSVNTYAAAQQLCERLTNKSNQDVKVLEDENSALRAKVEALSQQQRLKHAKE